MKKITSLILLIATLASIIISCNKAPATSTPQDTTANQENEQSVPLDEEVIINNVADNYSNDPLRLSANDKMTFSSHWKTDQNYFSRFIGGDECWVNTSKVPAGESAKCTVEFFGHSIKIFGHMGTSGGMATITLDGKKVEEPADFYASQRTESLTGKYSGILKPFFEINNLENTQHTITITLLTNKKNSSQSGDPEIAVDYALVTRHEGSVGAKLPVIETAFEGFIGETRKYAYVSDYANTYHSFKLASKTKSESLTMFKNDISNSAIDIISGKKEITLKASASEFKNQNGQVLSEDSIDLSFLEYVRNHLTNKKVFDILGENQRVFPAKSYGVLWVSVTTTSDTKAGTYTGNIKVSGDDLELVFPYTIEIIDLDIGAADAALTNELWMYPYSACRYYSGKSVLDYFGTDHNKSNKTSLRNVYLEDKYMPQLAEQIKLYAAGGGDVITATIVDEAWNSQTTDPYPSMVKWTKNTNGAWSFDYTDFDKWVELNMANGVDQKIKCYSLASWNEKIIYLDKSSNTAKTITCKIGTDIWKETWTAFLTNFMAHLKQKGWFEITYLSMDERGTEEIAAVCDLVSNFKDENQKSFKMSMAINRLTSSAYFDYFEDISVSSSQRYKLGNLIATRKAKGLSTTFYTCGATAGSLDNEPYETLDFFFFLYKNSCDGYLRWAFDAYTDYPLMDTSHWRFVAGDQNLIYPDTLDDKDPTVQSSVRYQILMESYKNICALETLKNTSSNAAREITALLNAYEGYSSTMFRDIQNMENSIVELARKVLNNK